jgi:predicted dehydrogenase
MNTRRHFFLGSLFTSAVPLAGYGSTASLKALGYRSPNEKLNVACVGAGGRATGNIAGVAPTENIVAMADVDAKRAAVSFNRFEKATKYTDFRKMLDKEEKSIDAVIVSTPDHMHATAALSAMERGKHVYCEKPLTRTVWEARMLTEAAAKYKVATQMGNQGYSNDGARLAAEMIWAGEIGQVTEVHAWTNRPIWPQGIDAIPAEEPVPADFDWDLWLGGAAARPYSAKYAPFNWRGWFDFGAGALGDMACHILGTPNMALGLTAPTSVEVIRQEGKNPYTFPKKSVTRFEFPARGSRAAVKVFWHDAQSGPAFVPPGHVESEPLIAGEGAFGARGVEFNGGGAVAAGAPQRKNTPGAKPGPGGGARVSPSANGAVFIGEKGVITSDTYGANIRLLPEARHREYKLPPQFLTRSPGHHRDWIRACKGGERACSDFSVAGPFTEWIVLGAIALRCEGKLEWDSARMRFTNNSEANQYVKPKFRKGWQIG